MWLLVCGYRWYFMSAIIIEKNPKLSSKSSGNLTPAITFSKQTQTEL